MPELTVSGLSRAVVVHELGNPKTFRLEDCELGPPGKGEARVRIRAAGVSFVDVLVAMGGYQVKPAVPFVPGSEFAGVVEAVGEGVDETRVGERVMGSAFGAAIAEAAVVPADILEPIPAGLSFEEAAVFPASYLTSYYALVDRAGITAGETVLVLGAAGATGYAAIQVAKAFGARVIASASTNEKRALALTGGADVAIDSNAPDWRDQVKAANNGKGVDIVFDPVGDRFTEPAFRSLGWNGRHLVVGFAAGQIAKVPANLALLKGASLVGVDVRQMTIFEPETARRDRKAIAALAAEGKLRPSIGMVYPIEDFAAAFEAAKSSRHAGRIVISMDR